MGHLLGLLQLHYSQQFEPIKCGQDRLLNFFLESTTTESITRFTLTSTNYKKAVVIWRRDLIIPSWLWTNTWKHCWTYLLSIPSQPQRTGVPVWCSGGARVRAPSTCSDCRLLWWPADLNLVKQVAHSWSSPRAHQREIGCGETHEDHWPRSRC